MNHLLSVIAQSHKLRVQDVFNVSLYTADGGSKDVVNGINLAGHGGLVYERIRNDNTSFASFIDSERGLSQYLLPSSSAAEGTDAGYMGSFNSNGYSLINSEVLGRTIASYTFRKAPRFLDIVTYTGNGTNRTIAHNLGVTPGLILVKRRTSIQDWIIWGSSLTGSEFFRLDHLNVNSNNNIWNSTTPTASVFSLGTHNNVNQSGSDYVAYLFANDPSGFVQTGQFAGSISNVVVDLGWEPQFLLFKKYSFAYNSHWLMFDATRGMSGGSDPYLELDTNAVETAADILDISSTGFTAKSGSSLISQSSSNTFYLAIRAP